jgi:hypothetical protein
MRWNSFLLLFLLWELCLFQMFDNTGQKIKCLFTHRMSLSLPPPPVFNTRGRELEHYADYFSDKFVGLCIRNYDISRTFISLWYIHFSPHSVDSLQLLLQLFIYPEIFLFKASAQFMYHGWKSHPATLKLFCGCFFQPYWWKQGGHTNSKNNCYLILCQWLLW